MLVIVIAIYLVAHLFAPLDWYLIYKLYKKLKG